MGLRAQLALIALVTLILPWAGCQYLRETEEALREGQQTMLLAAGGSIAALLGDRPSMFPPVDPADTASTLYAHDIRNTPTLDGFADDWTLPLPTEPIRPEDDFAILVGRTAQHLYLLADVVADGDAEGKRIEIATVDDDGAARVYRFEPVAPGPLPAFREAGDGPGVTELRVQGWWEPTTDGFHLEARLPLDLVGARLGVRVLARRDGVYTPIAATCPAGRPGRLAARSPALSELLANYARPGLELTATDAEGWRLASAGDLDTIEDRSDPPFTARIYRALIGGTAAALPRDPGRGDVVLPWLDDALSGRARAAWLRSPERGQAIASAAVPVRGEDGVIGALVMQESSAAILTLTNRALARLTSLTLLATLAVAAALLGYATWLSLRITRLSRAADEAISRGGQIRADLPSRGAGDELGDLARSFSSLLDRVRETNEYLRTLGARLSHELRTPLAVVTSSLDNLESVGVAEPQREYADRARGGAQRLQAILNAMSEASRTEQAVTAAEPERFDLVAVLTSAVGGYADAYPERHFDWQTRVPSARITGAPELLVQMLDKLVANAVEFSRAGDRIDIELEQSDGRLSLTVSNPGPLLPEAMREQIFDSLVTLRPGAGGSHLGLGLYIARLIAESHGGRIRAENRPDATGVTVSVDLPLADQPAAR